MDSRTVSSLHRSQVFQQLESLPRGLSEEEAQARLNAYGQNVLAEPPSPVAWRRWISSIAHPMALLLWLAGALILINGQTSLGFIVWALVLVNGGFSYWREYRAGRAISQLKAILPAYTHVLRDGVLRTVPAKEIVPGDVLVLSQGDNVPADARVVEAYGLSANHANLSGEASPVRKTTEVSRSDDLSEIERPNLVFAGTSVVAGTGRAVVYATGMFTQFGRLASLTHKTQEKPGFFQKEMVRLSRRLAILALIAGVIVFVVAQTDVGMVQKEALALAIGIIVAVIPEGLASTLTLTLAIGGQRLAQRGALVKNLSVLEKLGSTSVIFTDKSGTLTQNQMTVRNFWAGGRFYNVEGNGYEPVGKIIPLENTCELESDAKAFIKAAVLCNNARLLPPDAENTRWSNLGDQSEAALLVLGAKAGIESRPVAYHSIHELPFDAHRKRMSILYEMQGKEFAFIKGAPRDVLALCTQVLLGDVEMPLTEELKSQILKANDSYASQTMRVLALAQRVLPARRGPYTIENVEKDLVFLGLAALSDPPRPEVARSIDAFRSAGIRMVMITGDYGLTAESLARRIGMVQKPVQIVTGVEMEGMKDEELGALVRQEVIYARVTPDQKMRLVAAYQEQGEVVTVIGDGVNDVPALRKADVGVAMGLSGTDVARDAADVIITNDNFELLVYAIREGRAVYQNVRKFITYVFTSNVPEILPFILAALFNLPLALQVLQILTIDLGTDLFPALALGMEKPEPDIMQYAPRKKNTPLLDAGLLWRSFTWLGMIEAVLCFAAFFLVYYGPQIIHAQWVQVLLGPGAGFEAPAQRYILATTVYFAGVVICQVGAAIACRSATGNVRWLGLFSNPYLLGGIMVETGLMLAFIYFQPLSKELGMAALPSHYWIWLVLFAPLLYGLERGRKSFSRWIEGSKSQPWKHILGRRVLRSQTDSLPPSVSL